MNKNLAFWTLSISNSGDTTASIGRAQEYLVGIPANTCIQNKPSHGKYTSHNTSPEVAIFLR